MIGHVISHYRIIERIGCGGMGLVYKCADTRLGRMVALKFLPGDFEKNKEAKERFNNEARAASSLQHQNICTIHDIDETDDGRIFICMDYYEGKTLKERIAEAKSGNAIDPAEAAEIAKQIAAGLNAAHANGIIHRDIKPSNIFITKDNIVKILDFGLAKLSGGSAVTRIGETAGTAAYMSPEQAKGETVDQHTDIWSFGVVLYEMLTGELPFAGDYDQAVIYSILNGDPSDKLERMNNIPDYLKQLCLKCLSKHPGERPRDFAGIIDSIEEKLSAPFRHSGKIRIRRKAIYAAAILISIAASIFFMIIGNGPSENAAGTKLRIAIISFRNNIHDDTTQNWPELVQSVLAGQLTGREEFAVMDVFNFNGMMENKFGSFEPQRTGELYKTVQASEINYLIDGAIYRNGKGYMLNSNVVDPETGNTCYSSSVNLGNSSSLLNSVSELAHKIYDYFRVQVLKSSADKNLKPWISQGTKNLEAQEAFIEASKLIYNLKPGADQLLRKAILLDSAFVSARVWFISILYYSGDSAETQKQLLALEKLEPDATPFELAMINWAKAFSSGNLAAQAKSISSALSYSPGNNILLINLADLSYMLDDINGALEALSDIEKSGWYYPPQYPLLVKCYIRRGMFGEAEKKLNAAFEKKPIDPELHLLKATLNFAENDTAGYRLNIDKYFNSYKEKNNRMFASILEEVGDIYSKINYRRTAKRIYDDALKICPDKKSIGGLKQKINSLN